MDLVDPFLFYLVIVLDKQDSKLYFNWYFQLKDLDYSISFKDLEIAKNHDMRDYSC